MAGATRRFSGRRQPGRRTVRPGRVRSSPGPTAARCGWRARRVLLTVGKTPSARDLAPFHLLPDDRPGGLELADRLRQIGQKLRRGLVVRRAGLSEALRGVAGVEDAGVYVFEQHAT